MRREVRVTTFAKSERGTVAIIWVMALVVFFGFLAMIFDIGGGGATLSEMQSFADRVALGAAGELDGGRTATGAPGTIPQPEFSALLSAEELLNGPS